MNRSFPTAIALALLGSSAATASADSIVLVVEDRRFVFAVEK